MPPFDKYGMCLCVYVCVQSREYGRGDPGYFGALRLFTVFRLLFK